MPAANRRSEPSLFPIIPTRLTGLARLAAEALPADDGHQIEFRNLQVRSVINRSVSKRRLWMDFSINPYRGCEFGCKYCYARYTHEFLAPAKAIALPSNSLDLRDPEAFERIVFLKQNAAWLLEQDLRRIDPACEIALGTATDPYQPIERKVGITRSLLEVFARKQGYRLGIVTKSTLIERDIDLLVEIGRRNKLTVHMTITTPDAKLARKLEPRAPRPDLRFAVVRRLREAGIRAGILCCPLLPGITDSAKAIDGMARRAAAVGASFFAGNPLFLKPCSRPTYFHFLQENFPQLVADYEAWFGKADFASTTYSKQMAKLVETACRRHKLPVRFHDPIFPRNEDLDRKPDTDNTAAFGRIPPTSAGDPCQQRLFA